MPRTQPRKLASGSNGARGPRAPALATVGQNVTTYQDTTAPSPTAGYRVTAIPTGGGYSNIIYSTSSPPNVLSLSPPSLTFSCPISVITQSQKSVLRKGS